MLTQQDRMIIKGIKYHNSKIKDVLEKFSKESLKNISYNEIDSFCPKTTKERFFEEPKTC